MRDRKIHKVDELIYLVCCGGFYIHTYLSCLILVSFDEPNLCLYHHRSHMSSRAKSLSADGWIAKQVANAGGDKAAALVAFKKKPNVNVVVQYCGD